MPNFNTCVSEMRNNFKNNKGLPKSSRAARNVLDTLNTWKCHAEVDDLIKIVEDLISSLVAKEKKEELAREMKKKMEEENAKKEEDKMKTKMARIQALTPKKLTQEKAKKEEEIGKNNGTCRTLNSTFLHKDLQNLQKAMRIEEDDKVIANCCEALEALVRANLSGKWFVHPFGSAVNGFGTRYSDIDVTICEVDQESDTQSVLEKLLKVFQNSESRFSVTEAILSARVPILKLVYHDGCSGRQEVDLSVNNRYPLLNTRLLEKYSSMDVPHMRVRLLVVAVKLWAKKHNVCGAPVLQKKVRFLPAYAWNLMAIYFLQVKVGLPRLSLRANPHEKRINWESKLSVASLFTEFFVWYADEFGWCHEVVSIRTGRRVDKKGAEFQALDKQRRKLLIEDPYVTTRNLSDVLTDEAELETYNAIMNMARACKSYRTELSASAGESSSAVLLPTLLVPTETVLVPTETVLVPSCYNAEEPSPAYPKLTRKGLVNKKLDEPAEEPSPANPKLTRKGLVNKQFDVPAEDPSPTNPKLTRKGLVNEKLDEPAKEPYPANPNLIRKGLVNKKLDEPKVREETIMLKEPPDSSTLSICIRGTFLETIKDKPVLRWTRSNDELSIWNRYWRLTNQ